MASGDSRAAEALAAFALSSPDPSDFGSSPAGSALRKARNDCERVFLAAFEGSPSSHGESSPARDGPAQTSSLHPTPVRLSRAIHEEQIPSQEQSLLQKIAESLEEDAGSAESANDLLSDDFEDADSDSSDGEVPSPIPVSGSSRPSIGTSKASVSVASSTGVVSSSISSSAASKFELSNILELASKYEGGLRGKLPQQRATHSAMARIGHAGFFCSPDCNLKGSHQSCLDSGFDRTAFREFHVHTYGRASNLYTLTEVKSAVHARVWELRSPLPSPQPDGRLFKVDAWRLGGPNGKRVCKKAFIAATGGTNGAHRAALTLTIAGKDPSDQKAYKSASLVVKKLHQCPSARGEWAQSWWKRHLMCHDWLPNELSIQYRGPTWTCVWQDFYEPEAKRANMVLQPRQWMRNRKPAVKKLHLQFFPNATHKCLTVVRSARHSNFPECTDCQNLRRNFKALTSNPRATEQSRAGD